MAAFFKGTGFLLSLKPSGPAAPCRTGIVRKKPGFRSATSYEFFVFHGKTFYKEDI